MSKLKKQYKQELLFSLKKKLNLKNISVAETMLVTGTLRDADIVELAPELVPLYQWNRQYTLISYLISYSKFKDIFFIGKYSPMFKGAFRGCDWVKFTLKSTVIMLPTF